MAADPARPPGSVTTAVMVWLPAPRAAVEMLLPVPRLPARLELQARPAARLPLSASAALPERVTPSPTASRAPLAGERIATTGAVLAAITTIVTVAVAELPFWSVTRAVTRWVPAADSRPAAPDSDRSQGRAEGSTTTGSRSRGRRRRDRRPPRRGGFRFARRTRCRSPVHDGQRGRGLVAHHQRPFAEQARGVADQVGKALHAVGIGGARQGHGAVAVDRWPRCIGRSRGSGEPRLSSPPSGSKSFARRSSVALPPAASSTESSIG